jgi:hypothetical protein
VPVFVGPGAGAAAPAPVFSFPLSGGGSGGGGGGGAAVATENPARSFSSVYLALDRSAIRLWVSLSRWAVVIAWVGGGGTVARFG